MAASGNTLFFPWEVALMEWLQAHIGGAGISIISLFSMFGEELWSDGSDLTAKDPCSPCLERSCC